MGLSTIDVVGVKITSSSKNEILEEVQKYLVKTKNQKPKTKNEDIKPLVIFTPNPEIITYAQKDLVFRQIVNSAQINLPDGVGVCWAIYRLHKLHTDNIPGIDLVAGLVQLAKDMGFTIGLIGGRAGVALKALECLQRSYNNLSGWAMDGPEVKITNYKLQITNNKTKDTSDGVRMHSSEVEKSRNSYFASLVNEIEQEKTDILFIALGFPKQEYFIESVKRKALSGKLNRPLVLMAVGGAFDYISGKVPRASLWIRNKGLEWLYRLIREPWRLSRQLKGAEFFWRVLTSYHSESRFNRGEESR